jgi:hypothetical protein
MNTKLKLMATAGGFAVAMLGAAPAFAAGTAAGTSINNVATVNYTVGGVAQTAINSNTNTITVDRRVNLVVAEVGNATTNVVPGQLATGTPAPVTAFTVTNTSNAPLDLLLTVTQPVGGTAAHGGTDNFDITGATIYADTNGNGSYDIGTDLAITFLDEIAADAVRTVFVVGGIPNTRVNGDVAEVNLIAQAAAPGTAGTAGAALTETAGANTAGVDTVFGDAAGTATGDVARDGRHSDDDDYTVGAPALTVTKQSTLLWDPLNGLTNPKMIPGAVVEYCIRVANGAGGALAQGISVSDPMPKDPANPTIQAIDYYGTASANAANGDAAPVVLRNVDADAACAAGTAGGATAGTAGANNEVVSGTLSDIAAGVTRSFRFRARIR